MGLNVEESNRTGRPIPRVVEMACITPHGSKDCVEKLAVEWLEQYKQKALRGEVSAEWLDMFSLQYTEWKKGNDLPRSGTPTKTWPGVTKEQQLRLMALGYTTIEDLAACPDGDLGTIGLDGRHLRDLARNWINEGTDKGINAKKLADAELKLSELIAQNNELRERLTALESAPERRGPGRPRKIEDTA